MAKKNLSIILKEASEFKKKEERVEYLRANDSAAIRNILGFMFHPDVKFALPESDPPYKPSEFDEPGRLYNEVRRLYLFTPDGNPNLKQVRREFLFIELLENVDAEDAKLLLAIKNKKSPYKGLTKDVVIAAYPGLFPT